MFMDECYGLQRKKKYFGLYSCLLGPWQKKCMKETLKGNVLMNTISITPAATFINLSSIALMLSSLDKGLFLLPLWTL